jgi:ATP-dependent Lhr-like helicase
MRRWKSAVPVPVHTRRATEVRNADDLGALDAAAIERVRQEAWPIANTADEMYDALMVAGYFKEDELAPHWPKLLSSWANAREETTKRGMPTNAGRRRAARVGREPSGGAGARHRVIPAQAGIQRRQRSPGCSRDRGRILRGRFTPGTPEIEWCDRRLLARIHRYTLSRLRSEIEPVTAADFMRFLAHWQHVAGEDQLHETEGLLAAVEQLEGLRDFGRRLGARHPSRAASPTTAPSSSIACA